MHPHRPQTQNPGQADPRQPCHNMPSRVTDDLASLREEFPGFRICREVTGERVRYVAQRLHPGTRPYTVVTADPAELRAALGGHATRPHGHEPISTPQAIADVGTPANS